MKKTFAGLAVGVLLFCSTFNASATLISRGTDSLGNKLIYDTDLDITWYDYSNSKSTWQDQMAWAGNLTVEFNGNIINDWRLPSTIDGAHTLNYIHDPNDADGGLIVSGGYPGDGYEGDPEHDGVYNYSEGFNLANSELGHLFYTELGNIAYYGTDGTYQQAGWGLTNTGVFDNLVTPIYGTGNILNKINYQYYSSTTHNNYSGCVWAFDFGNGWQSWTNSPGYQRPGIAVRNGDVAPVPEPATMLLFGTGIVGLAGTRLRRKKK